MKKFECVVINGRFLTQKMTGVQRFAYESVKALDSLAENSTIPFILAVPSSLEDYKIPQLKSISLKKFGKHSGILWAQTELSRFIRKNKALGVHLCNAVPLFNPKGIVCIHDISYKIHPEFVTTKKHKLIRLWHLIQNRVSIKKSLSILTVSETSKKEIYTVYKVNPEKITVVYNGWQHFDTTIPEGCSLSTYPFLKEKEFFYSMSSLGKNKNFDWIVKAAQNNPDKEFAVAGSNDLKKYGSTLADQKEIKNLHYLGYVSDGDAKLLMKNCRAFIFPSIYEGFGIPPLEALAMGTKVICSNASCLPEIFKNSVYYINPNDYTVNLDELLQQKVSDAEEVLSLYSWDKTAFKIFENIKTIFNYTLNN